MAYLRWSDSLWYVFAHVQGGLAVWPARSICRTWQADPDAGGTGCWADIPADQTTPVYDWDEIEAFVAGRRSLDDIPGFEFAPQAARDELVLTLVQALIDERRPAAADQAEGRDVVKAILADQRQAPESGDDPSGIARAWEHERRLNARMMAVLSPEQRRQLWKEDDHSG